MIEVTNEYKAAVNADQRHWRPKVEVYFDGPEEAPTVFEGDDITGITLLEEAWAESGNPLGLVSANEVAITFANHHRHFMPTNVASPYYGKLKPNLMFKPFLGLEVASGTFEYIPLGVFKNGDWRAPSAKAEATVTAYDRLYELGERDVPMIAMVPDTTIGQLFAILLEALGLSPGDEETEPEFVIDPALSQPVRLGYIPHGKVRQALQYLAIAGCANVTADRQGVVRVSSNFTSGDPVQTWTDDNQIYDAENPQRYLECFSAIKVNSKMPRLDPLETLLQIDRLVIPTGGLTVAGAEFSAGPVARVEQVRLIGAVNSEVASIEYGAWTITVAIANEGPQETVTLEVVGHDVDFVTTPYHVEDVAAIADFGRKELTVNNHLIQDAETAQDYAQALLRYCVDPYVNFLLSTRGDPAVEVVDIVQIQNPTDLMGTVDIVPRRISLDFDGGLSARVEARKPIPLEVE